MVNEQYLRVRDVENFLVEQLYDLKTLPASSYNEESVNALVAKISNGLQEFLPKKPTIEINLTSLIDEPVYPAQ